MLRIKTAVTLAALGTAAALVAGPASAASGWTIVSAPPTGQNANLQGVSAVSDSDAWAVGSTHGAANTGIGSKVLIDNWNGTAWSQVATPATPGRDRLGGRPERGLWLVQSARAPERLTAGCAPRPVRVTRTGRGVRSLTC